MSKLNPSAVVSGPQYLGFSAAPILTQQQQNQHSGASSFSSTRHSSPPLPAPVAPIRSYIINQELIKFLKHVGFGEQDQANAMLQANPILTTLKGDLTDCSVYPETYGHRVFPNITALQYAVWALDFHMWRMIKQHMEKNNQQAHLHAQLEELNDIAILHTQGNPVQQGWVIKPGKSIEWPVISWTILIKALEEYVINKEIVITNRYHWCQQVGGAQLILPAHVINEYSYPRRSFHPCPEWGDSEKPLPRKGVDFWLNLGTQKLSKDYAWRRGDNLVLKRDHMGEYYIGYYVSAKTDLDAVSKLLTTRAAQAQVLLDFVLGSKAKDEASSSTSPCPKATVS